MHTCTALQIMMMRNASENILVDLDTEFVFNIQTLKGPKILHHILYQYLELKGIKFDVERNGKSILSNLAVVMTVIQWKLEIFQP